MTFFDGLIIYLTLAAPFAVYQFLQDRKVLTKLIWLETIFNIVFWLPLAARLGLRALIKASSQTVFANANNSDAEFEKKVHCIQGLIKTDLRSSGRPKTIHNFCEVFDRYVGLTIIWKKETVSTNRINNDFFAIGNHPNSVLAAACLSRCNLNRIHRHQAKARIDFLAFVAKNERTIHSEDNSILLHALKLTELLGDDKAAQDLRIEIARHKVVNTEKAWISESPQPSAIERISMS